MRPVLLIFLAFQIGFAGVVFATEPAQATTREERMTEALKNFRQVERDGQNMKRDVTHPVKAKHHNKKHQAKKHHPKSPSLTSPSP